jgi:tRNA pseudouridine13 synthase
MSRWRLEWPTARGERLGTATIRETTEDFFVDETLAVQLSGDGEHLCLRLKKSGDNTEYVARQLVALAECRAQDVSFCGLKDRHAVTLQWFSIHRPGATDDATLVAKIQQHWPVLETSRHRRKLRRGDHAGNTFRLCLRHVTADPTAVTARLHAIQKYGGPNYFGPQRFGYNGDNLEKAISQRGMRRRGRNFKAGLYFSAARAWLFNEVLAERIQQGTWDRVVPGEPDPDQPTGPLWGDGGTQASGELEAIERAVVDAHPLLASVFADTRTKPERRNLLLPLTELEFDWTDSQTLVLQFRLGKGSFATALLGEVFNVEAGGSAAKAAS